MKSFYNEKKQQFDISKVPDIYDSAKYDAIHNSHLQLSSLPVRATDSVSGCCDSHLHAAHCSVSIDMDMDMGTACAKVPVNSTGSKQEAIKHGSGLYLGGMPVLSCVDTGNAC